MKKTRKFAALLAAVMAVSCMGAMNAFAADEISMTIDSGGQIGDIATYVDGEESFTNVYNSGQTWNISITGDELCWTITKTGTRTHALTWNGTSYNDSSADSGISYDWKDSSAKTVTLTNGSNFDVSTTAQWTQYTNPDTNQEYPGTFSVSDNVSTMTSSSKTATVTVTPNTMRQEEFAELFALQKHGVGQLTLMFSKSGGLYSYGVNAVTDTTT